MASENQDDEPRRARRPRRDDRDDRDQRDEDYEDDDRPRRRRRRRDDDDNDYEEGDSTGGLIPYKNGMALAAYYCSIASLIPPLGLFLGVISIIFGLKGLKHKSLHPKHGGSAHAIIGIVLGALTALGSWVLAIVLIVAAMQK